MSASHQEAYKLIAQFDELYLQKYGEKYRGNRHADKWGFIDMIDDLTYDGAVKVIKYYFRTKPHSGHSREHLRYHYHEYAEALDAQRKERALKRQILKRMREQYEG